MNRRTLLRRQLIEAWEKAIDTDYKRQRINSERSLQASMWSQLNAIFGDMPRRMFIEPGLVVQKSTGQIEKMTVRVPDLVICNSVEIIAVVELKYQPRVKPSYSKDLDTLEWIATHGGEIAVTNARFRGKVADAHRYRLSNSVVYAWAGVHRDANVALPIPQKLKANFLELHAITNKDGDPTVWIGR